MTRFEYAVMAFNYGGSTRLSGEGGSGCGVAVGVMAR